MKNNPIKTFNTWAEKNKDAGMEKNHSSSVNYMLQKIPSSILSNKFSFLNIVNYFFSYSLSGINFGRISIF